MICPKCKSESNEMLVIKVQKKVGKEKENLAEIEICRKCVDKIFRGVGKWMNSGTMQNGRFSTAKISEFHKTAKGGSLSDILEGEVEERYFES